MNVLIVYAHPEPQSFNGAMKDLAVETLTELGHQVVVSDLYGMGFEAAAGPRDVTRRMNETWFNLAREQGHAAENDLFAPDIQAEIDKVRAADFLLLQFPMWWYSMPAILKGWVERVLAYKVAYGLGQWWDEGPFKGRRAMLSLTIGQPASAFFPDGRNGDIDRILWPLHAGLLRICGYEVLPAFVAYEVPWIGDEGRKAILSAYKERLVMLDDIEPLFFHTLAEIGPDHRLKPDIEPSTPGQHRGGKGAR